jgi:hypothetical protein
MNMVVTVMNISRCTPLSVKTDLRIAHQTQEKARLFHIIEHEVDTICS